MGFASKWLNLKAIAALIGFALIWYLAGEENARLVPVLVSLAVATLFIGSLFFADMPLVERIARATNQNFRPEAVRYCRIVTQIWAVVLLSNAVIALWTALQPKLEIWLIYNGLISNIVYGLVFLIEYRIRVRFRARIGE